jgi:hypothetical protein
VYRKETQISFLQANKSGLITDYEEFSKASQHYADVLNNEIANMNLESSSLHSGSITLFHSEISKLQETLFSLCLYLIKEIQANLSEIKFPQANSALVPPSIEELEDVYKKKNTTILLMSDLVAFQKKAAEAGNAYFWNLQEIDAKRNLSRQMFRILDELEENLMEESRFIPQHMRALLYQNLGIVLFEEFQNVKIVDLLAAARSNIENSLAIFNQPTFSLSTDSSVQLEHLQSIQMLAAIDCLNHQFGSGISFWKKAILKARQNAGLLTTGIHYEKLSIVLYNAAICYQENNESSTALNLLIDSKLIVESLIESKSAKSFNSASPSSSAFQQEIQDLEFLLSSIESYRNHLQELVRDQPKVIPEGINRMKTIQTEQGVKYIPTIGDERADAKDDDDYEWEECLDFEADGCESFYVTSETEGSNVLDNDDEHLYEGLSEEERLELMDVRSRYGKFTEKQKDSKTIGGAILSNDEDKIEGLRKENEDLKEKLGKSQREIVKLERILVSHSFLLNYSLDYCSFSGSN